MLCRLHKEYTGPIEPGAGCQLFIDVAVSKLLLFIKLPRYGTGMLTLARGPALN